MAAKKAKIFRNICKSQTDTLDDILQELRRSNQLQQQTIELLRQQSASMKIFMQATMPNQSFQPYQFASGEYTTPDRAMYNPNFSNPVFSQDQDL